MAYPQFQTNLMSKCKVIELLFTIKEHKGKNYIKVKPRNRLLAV